MSYQESWEKPKYCRKCGHKLRDIDPVRTGYDFMTGVERPSISRVACARAAHDVWTGTMTTPEHWVTFD